MNVVALVDRPDHVCCRYRIAAFQSLLRCRGIELQIRQLSQSFLSRCLVYSQLKPFDAVVLQRKLLSPFELWLLRRNSKRLIFDYDDAVWLRDSYSGKGFDSPKRASRFHRLVQVADAFFAGNDYLASYAQQLQSRVKIHVIPTCVDPDKYPLCQYQNQVETRLVWVGSASTLQGLDQFRNVLELIGKQLPNIRLRLICDRFLKFEHLPVEEILWSEATEGRHIAESDIGISWIPDDPWSRGKCGLKILQYQAAGLPVVTNPVGVHPLMLGSDRGILANTPEEWLQAIARLQRDPLLRQQMGRAGRANVEQLYSVSHGAELWEQALRVSA
jgi:glycosyltransferase involved in cell wall biosynthesis